MDAGGLVDAVALVIGKAPTSSGDRDVGLVADRPGRLCGLARTGARRQISCCPTASDRGEPGRRSSRRSGD
jgi:hypothetical protein